MREKANVLLVDDHYMVITGIVKLLEKEEDIQVVGAISDPKIVIKRLEELSVDVLIIDVRLQNASGIQIAKHVKILYPHIKIIILSGYNFEEYQRAAFLAGADAFISKEHSVTQLASAVQNVISGNILFPSSIITNQSSEMRLTPTEMVVLTHISKDKSNAEISFDMKVSKRTVEHHVSVILQKLNCASRVGAVVEGLKKGLINT